MRSQWKKFILGIGIVISATALSLSPALAEKKYPLKPIQMIIPFSAGGSTDVIARNLIEGAKEHLGVPIVILNKPGGDTAIGMDALRKAKPDGYTIGMNGTSSIILPAMGRVEYDFFEDFSFVCNVTKWIIGFAVNSSSPWKTFQEFQAYAKENPGKVKFGSATLGSMAYLCAENLAKDAGIKIVGMPMASGAETAAALLGNHIQAASIVWVDFGEHVKAGKMRLLVLFGDERIPELPDVPIAKELGLNIGAKGPIGVMGPKGLPPEVVKTLFEAFQKAAGNPNFKRFMESTHYPIVYLGPGDFKKECKEYQIWAEEHMKRIGMIK